MCQNWSRCGPQLFPVFRSWHSRFSKYLSGVMICATLFSLPVRDSSLCVFILVKDRDYLMSCTQAVSFYLCMNSLRVWVWMFHPRQILCLSNRPSTDRLQS